MAISNSKPDWRCLKSGATHKILAIVTRLFCIATPTHLCMYIILLLFYYVICYLILSLMCITEDGDEKDKVSGLFLTLGVFLCVKLG